MQSLRFNRLLLLSNTEKSANLFEFSKTLNLVTAKDNSVGKSTLLKLLFWVFGCEPEFDTTWKSKECTALVEFEIGISKYKIKRYNKAISLKIDDKNIKSYSHVTGEFSKMIADILGFKALLPNQSNLVLETPPPAYYFIPFYIDQKRSWATAWNNFENLGQYQAWKPTIIRYHVGLLPPEHFEIEIEKFEKKAAKNRVEIEVQKIDTTIEIVSDYIPEPITTVTTVEEFDALTENIKQDLRQLQQSQEILLTDIALNNSEKIHLVHQKEITEGIIVELGADYKFSVEYIPGDEIECPLCGTMHENSLVNRASILVDKTQAENQLFELNKAIEKIDGKILKSAEELKNVRGQISDINEKYVVEDQHSNQLDFNQIIESIAGNTIKKNVIKSRAAKIVQIEGIGTDLRELTKSQRELVTKETIEERNALFLSIFMQYLKDLDSESINMSEINSPLDYNKVIKEGGAAEGARAILAYYLAIYAMVERFGNGVVSPLVIDTPNQQEQSDSNYDRIINLLSSKLNQNQVIMSAMENEHLKPLISSATVITLDSDKLLKPALYESVKAEIDSLK